MPSNFVTINHTKKLEWIVPDSQIEKVFRLLNECGDSTQRKPLHKEKAALFKGGSDDIQLLSAD